jgi:hypothetical protein
MVKKFLEIEKKIWEGESGTYELVATFISVKMIRLGTSTIT